MTDLQTGEMEDFRLIRQDSSQDCWMLVGEIYIDKECKKASKPSKKSHEAGEGFFTSTQNSRESDMISYISAKKTPALTQPAWEHTPG